MGREQVAEPLIKTASRPRTAAHWRVARAGSHDGRPNPLFYHLGAGCQYHSVIFVQGSDGGRVACVERSGILIIKLLNCGN